MVTANAKKTTKTKNGVQTSCVLRVLVFWAQSTIVAKGLFLFFSFVDDRVYNSFVSLEQGTSMGMALDKNNLSNLVHIDVEII